MHVANVSIVISSGTLFQSWFPFLWAGVLLVGFHPLVILHEEPTLHRCTATTTSRTGGPWAAGFHAALVVRRGPDDIETLLAISKEGGPRLRVNTRRHA
jgi:hypothetical protein